MYRPIYCRIRNHDLLSIYCTEAGGSVTITKPCISPTSLLWLQAHVLIASRNVVHALANPLRPASVAQRDWNSLATPSRVSTLEGNGEGGWWRRGRGEGEDEEKGKGIGGGKG